MNDAVRETLPFVLNAYSGSFSDAVPAALPRSSLLMVRLPIPNGYSFTQNHTHMLTQSHYHSGRSVFLSISFIITCHTSS